MTQKRQFLIVVGIILVTLCGLLVYTLLKLSPNGLISSTGSSISSEIPSIDISLKNKTEYENILEEFVIVDKVTVEGLNVRIVKDIQDPTYSQVDENNKKVIASSYSIDNKIATIYISPGDLILNESPEMQKQWIESEFWRVAELIMKRNVGSAQRVLSASKPDLFIVNKK